MIDIIAAIAILMQIESTGNPKAIGDNGASIGVLQIQEIYVRECNRFAGVDTFTYEDRWSVRKSKLMTAVFLRGQLKKYRNRFGMDPSLQLLLESHQSGCIFKKCTPSYRIKVSRAIGRLKN
jgi:hypothetical protein